jgi:hypothetical protein
MPKQKVEGMVRVIGMGIAEVEMGMVMGTEKVIIRMTMNIKPICIFIILIIK